MHKSHRQECRLQPPPRQVGAEGKRGVSKGGDIFANYNVSQIVAETERIFSDCVNILAQFHAGKATATVECTISNVRYTVSDFNAGQVITGNEGRIINGLNIVRYDYIRHTAEIKSVGSDFSDAGSNHNIV